MKRETHSRAPRPQVRASPCLGRYLRGRRTAELPARYCPGIRGSIGLGRFRDHEGFGASFPSLIVAVDRLLEQDLSILAHGAHVGDIVAPVRDLDVVDGHLPPW